MLEIGQTISHYRIIEKLGQGGMGEVFLAQDTSLDRKVALKFLPDIFSGDPERLARFEREAKLLASLNHPNIATIYGLEQADGKRFLAMELVEGETLAERIGKAPLPVEETIAVCLQIAEGLEAAHERVVIHRDLKPANVKITPTGKAKILDFGLAKALQGETSAADASKSPTLTDQMTRPGVILGTAAYMAPEQAKGKAVDKRADIWAFGCILYECLTGKRAFDGETISETLAAILKGEPDWATLPETTPDAIKGLLQRCLQKDPHKRIHDIADARIEMDDDLIMSPPSAAAAPKNGRQSPLHLRPISLSLASVCLILFGVLIGALFVRRFLQTQPSAQLTTKSVLPLSSPPKDRRSWDNPALAISPDGRRLVYLGMHEGTTRLFLRQLDQWQASSIPGTDGAIGPFFSPDGERIGFFVEGRLKKVSLADGSTSIIADSPGPIPGGGFWGTDDEIIYMPLWNSGLWRVSAGIVGPQQPFTRTNAVRGDFAHLWPQILPGGQTILFITKSGRITDMDDAEIVLQPVATGNRQPLGLNAAYARYVPATGHIVYVRNSVMFAVPFDLTSLKITGKPAKVVEGIMLDFTTGAAQFTLSNTGVLAYIPGGKRTGVSLVWADRHGAQSEVSPRRAIYHEPRLYANGRLAVRIAGANDDVHVCDLTHDNWSRLTDEEGDESCPVWSPDGKKIAYGSESGGPANLFWRASDGSEPPQLLWKNENQKYPSSFSPDGKYLAYVEMNPVTRADIWLLPIEGDRKPQKLLQTQYDESAPRFSPDGRWLAYTSNHTDRNEVYLLDFPAMKNRQKISVDGGSWPVWASKRGRELYYLNGKKIMAVSIDLQSGIPGVPSLLFECDNLLVSGDRLQSNYDVTEDGQRFLLRVNSDMGDWPVQINLVTNWFEELKRLCPTGKK